MNGYTGETIEDTNMPTTTKIGYILDGWYKEATLENKVEVLPEKYPAGTTTYYAKWIPRDDTKYNVEYYYQKDDGTYPIATELLGTDIILRKGTTDTEANVTEQDKTPKKVAEKTYVFDSENKNNVLSGNIAGNGSLILKVYFKQQFTVTYKPGTKGTFEEQSIGSLDYEAKTPKYNGNPTGEPGYTFTGWDPEVKDKVTGNQEYVAQWEANTDTKYMVEYYYQKDDGTYPIATELKATDIILRKGTTDTQAAVTEQDKTPNKVAGKTYAFDSENTNNVLSGNIAGNGSLVLKVYFKQQYTVTYKPGTKGTFEEQKTENLDYGAKTPKYNGNPTGEAGYTFTGWEPTVEETVTGNKEYVAQWKANEDTKYTVEYYYQENGAYAETTELKAERTGTTDTQAKVTDADKIPAEGKAGYVYDEENANNVLSGNIAGNGSLVLKVYFKQQFTVTYKPGTKGTFEEQKTENLDYGAKTPKYNGNPTGEAGYTFTGWEPTVEETVTGNKEYVAQWKANEDTKYTVEYYYQENGAYAEITELKAERTGTTDTQATVTDADKIPAEEKIGYVYDTEASNVEEGIIKGDGSLVLKVYFKQQFTVTYKPGTKGTFEEQSVGSLDYGTETPKYNGNPTGEAGYTFTGWEPTVEETVTGNKEYVAQWKANEDTKYTVEYYYQENGAYAETTELKAERTGTTDTQAKVTDADKIPAEGKAGYVYDEENANNVLSGNIAGNGSLVLKVYFKQQFTVTYKPGTKGTFEEQSVGSLDYGTETPKYNGEKDESGNPVGNPGYTFAGWSPEVDETVTKNQEYVAQWKANEDTKYTVKHWRQEPKGENEVKYKEVVTDTRTYYGTTGELATYAPKDNYRGFTYNPDLTTPSDKTIKGDGSLVINLYYTRNSYNYVTEYYYEGTTEPWIHDETENKTGLAEYKAVIEDYEDNVKDGYTFSKAENLPLTIEDNEEENVIKVYYVRAERDYVINYYHDSISEDNFIDKITGTAKHGDTITADTTKFVPDGYEFKGTAPSMVIKQEDNVINVVYVKKDYNYKVEYYYNDVLDYTFNGTQKYNSVVESYEVRQKDGYVFFEAKAAGKTSKTEGKISLTITDNGANNIIKVYYYSKPTVTIEKTANKTNVNAGDSITYSIKLTNGGKINSEAIKVTDTLPDGLTNVQVTGTDQDKATVSGNIITWENIVVEPGTKTLKVTAKVKDNIIGSTLTNTATINQGAVGNNTSKVSTKVKELSVSTTGVIPGGIAKQNVNVVLAIDTSTSMDKDVNGNATKNTGLPSRYSIAKDVMKDFVKALYAENNQSTLTLVSFNRNASIVSVNGKATSVYADKENILAQIDNIERKSGTNMYDGLSLAGYTIDSLSAETSQFKDNKNIIIFLGDGAPGWARGEEGTANWLPENRANGIIRKATEIKNKGTEIYTIGFGNEAADSSTASDAGNDTPDFPGSAYYILNNMASPNKFYTAVTGAELVEAFNKIKDQEIKTDVTTNNGVVEIDLKGNELKTPVSVIYRGKKIIDCKNVKDLAIYKMEYKDGKLTWNVNDWNSENANTKVTTSDIVINYYASK